MSQLTKKSKTGGWKRKVLIVTFVNSAVPEQGLAWDISVKRADLKASIPTLCCLIFKASIEIKQIPLMM